MTSRKDYLERIASLKKRKERAVQTREKLLNGLNFEDAELSREHKIERIAISNMMIELFDKMISAYDKDKNRIIKDLWAEHNAIGLVAAEIICDEFKS